MASGRVVTITMDWCLDSRESYQTQAFTIPTAKASLVHQAQTTLLFSS